MNKFDLCNFIELTPPYVKIKLNSDDVVNIAHTHELSINQFCKNCGKESVFTYKEPSSSYYFSNIDGAFELEKLNIVTSKDKIQEKPLNSKDEIYKEMSFYCAKCKERHEFFFTTDRNYIMKVGQNPSFSDLQAEDINKYKNLIPKYFIEFKSSLNCYSQGKGIASFVYLRRILEDLIENEYKKYYPSTKKLKFIDKIKKVQQKEEIIPSEIEEIKNQLYGVLSKGVHEYDENECLELYEYVKLIIEVILDKQLAEKQKREKIKNAKNKINEKLGEK